MRVRLTRQTSIATNANPNPANATWRCGDQVLVINSSNVNNPAKTVQDFCPGCSTPGHIDTLSSSHACDVHLLPDYGNFYAIRLR